MDMITIAVLRVQGGWRVLKGRRPMGEFDYRVDAEEKGLQLTLDLHRAGRDVELLVQEEGSHDLTPMTGWETRH